MSDGAATSVEVLCVPGPTAALGTAAALAGLRATACSPSACVARLAEPEPSVAAVVVDATEFAVSDAMAACKALRRLDHATAPILVVVAQDRLDDLALRDELFDDFVVAPVRPEEVAARLRHLLAVRGTAAAAVVVEHGELAINVQTYQASVDGRVLDLTYMEYELLRFFASNPSRVLTRETLLNRVWGYEYYGGARTVDVHVRRLRAKLGEEHAHLIQTVRGVGYRFG
ncbi:MAG TPA: response regulator transcription factor [Acidimicrobiales bacterium]|nr:response regulator transcription factor [Acidimicrobiales bacterium]